MGYYLRVVEEELRRAAGVVYDHRNRSDRLWSLGRTITPDQREHPLDRTLEAGRILCARMSCRSDENDRQGDGYVDKLAG